MELFSGSAVALVTPFADGKVDFPALEALIEAQIAARTDAIVVLGTTGEPSTLLPEERREIIACAKERIGAQAQLIVGAGANCTRTAVGYAEEAEYVKELGRMSYRSGDASFRRIADQLCAAALAYDRLAAEFYPAYKGRSEDFFAIWECYDRNRLQQA